MQYYTTVEVAQMLHCNRRLVGVYQRYGALKGIRTGRGYIFSDRDIEEFYETYKGSDMTNAENVRINVKLKSACAAKPRALK